jgi:hypothetical protein
MNPDDLILLQLTKDARDQLSAIIDTTTKLFNDRGNVPPTIIFVKDEKRGMIGIGDADKTVVCGIINNLRQDCSTVIYVTGMMYVALSPITDSVELENQLSSTFSVAQNSREGIMVVLYVGRRNILFMTDVHRDPCVVDEWRIVGEPMGGQFG